MRVLYSRSVRLGSCPLPDSTRNMVYFRIGSVAGLLAGDDVRSGGETCGVVADFALVTGGVIVSCRLRQWPVLLHPVRAVICREEQTGRRYVLLQGHEFGEEELQPGDMLEGSVAVPAPAGELAPMRIQ